MATRRLSPRDEAAVRGVAAHDNAFVDAAFIDALPNLEIIANFGVGYDAVDARHAGDARRHGHQHARRADRGGGRHGDRPAAQHVREFPKAGKLAARRPLGGRAPIR
jgi:hypothetical protein